MAVSNRFQMDNNGNITGYDQTNWQAFWNMGRMPTDVAQWIAEYNQANNQYQQQYALQKDAYEWNKAMQEEAYYNGVLNEASQLSQLGINPASSGGSVSGTSAGSVSPGSASGRSAGAFHQAQKSEMLASLLQYALQKKQVDIAEYNAETQRISANASAGLSGSQKDYQDALTKFFEENGATASPYSGTKEGVREQNVWKIVGGFLTGAAGAGLISKIKPKDDNKNKKNDGNDDGPDDDGPAPGVVGEISMSPERYRQIYGDRDAASTGIEPDTSLYLNPGLVNTIRVLGKIGQNLTGKDWSDLKKALEDANSQEVTRATMALSSMLTGQTGGIRVW